MDFKPMPHACALREGPGAAIRPQNSHSSANTLGCFHKIADVSERCTLVAASLARVVKKQSRRARVRRPTMREGMACPTAGCVRALRSFSKKTEGEQRVPPQLFRYINSKLSIFIAIAKENSTKRTLCLAPPPRGTTRRDAHRRFAAVPVCALATGNGPVPAAV